jgi:hypothetical protein
MIDKEIVDYIKTVTIPIEEIQDNYLGSFKWLSNEIYKGKSPLKTNTVHFIIAKILTKNLQGFDIRKRDSFNVFVIGEFRKSFTPVLKVAEAFATFYREIGVLPNIIPMPKSVLSKNKELLSRLKNGVVLYERR